MKRRYLEMLHFSGRLFGKYLTDRLRMIEAGWKTHLRSIGYEASCRAR